MTDVRGVTVGLAGIDVRRRGAGPNETCTRTKLEGGLKSAACQAKSEGALSQLVQKFGSVTVLHVTVPLSNANPASEFWLPASDFWLAASGFRLLRLQHPRRAIVPRQILPGAARPFPDLLPRHIPHDALLAAIRDVAEQADTRGPVADLDIAE